MFTLSYSSYLYVNSSGHALPSHETGKHVSVSICSCFFRVLRSNNAPRRTAFIMSYSRTKQASSSMEDNGRNYRSLILLLDGLKRLEGNRAVLICTQDILFLSGNQEAL